METKSIDKEEKFNYHFRIYSKDYYFLHNIAIKEC